MKRLYFIRHGQSKMNVEGLFAGVTDSPLTAEGRRQATKAGKAAKKLNIDLIISSPLSRAHETAQLVAQEIGYPIDKIITSPLLVERDYGVLEGKTYIAGHDVSKVPNAENDKSMLARAREALDFIETQSAENILVVSHGAFGRALRHHTREDFPFSSYHRIANAEILEFI